MIAVPMEADAVIVALPLGVLKSKLDSEVRRLSKDLSLLLCLNISLPESHF